MKDFLLEDLIQSLHKTYLAIIVFVKQLNLLKHSL